MNLHLKVYYQTSLWISIWKFIKNGLLSMLHLILERSQFHNSLLQAFWTVSRDMGFNPVVLH